jgi:hypothetical protein
VVWNAGSCKDVLAKLVCSAENESVVSLAYIEKVSVSKDAAVLLDVTLDDVIYGVALDGLEKGVVVTKKKARAGRATQIRKRSGSGQELDRPVNTIGSNSRDGIGDVRDEIGHIERWMLGGCAFDTERLDNLNALKLGRGSLLNAHGQHASYREEWIGWHCDVRRSNLGSSYRASRLG